MKLVISTVAALLICLVLGAWARQSALSKIYAPFRHPLTEQFVHSAPVGFGSPLQEPGLIANSKEAIDWWINAAKAPFVLIEVFATADGSLLVPSSQQISELLPKKIEHFKTPKDLPFNVTSLTEILTRYPETRFVLNLKTNNYGIHHALKDFFTVEHPSTKDRVILKSDYATVIDNTKPLLPHWLYGTGRPTLVKFNILLALWLEPLASFNGDIIELESRPFSRETLQRAAKELQRRHKAVLFSDIDSIEQKQRAQSLGIPFLFLTNNSELF